MSASAEVAGRNGDRRTSPEQYRRAVKFTMRKQVRRNGSWVEEEPTEEEVNFLLLKAAEYGLNPLKGQIYATWRGGAMQVETTLDGLRVLAERTGQYRGQLPPEWFDAESGEWADVWTDDDKPPAAARVGILRKGFKEPVVVTVHWREFKQTKSNGELVSMWDEKGAHMLAKNSASLGLRAAFPGEAGGIYTAEEMAGIGQGGPPTDGDTSPPGRQGKPPRPPSNGSEPKGVNRNGAPPPAAAQRPSVVVDPPASQPSGPPATPATTGRLAAVLEKSGYSRLREDLARLVFDQQADRLNEERTARLANAMTAAENAGITAVELERACKRGLKYDDVAFRRKALFEWIAERDRKEQKDPEPSDAQAAATAGAANGRPSTDGQPKGSSNGAGPTEETAVNGERSHDAAERAQPPVASDGTPAQDRHAPTVDLPAPDADGGPSTTVDPPVSGGD